MNFYLCLKLLKFSMSQLYELHLKYFKKVTNIWVFSLVGFFNLNCFTQLLENFSQHER